MCLLTVPPQRGVFALASKEARNRRAVCCAMGPLLEDEDLVGLDDPGGELVHAGAGRLVDHVFLGESAGVEAGAAAGEVAAVAVVVSILSRV